ncbi:MAG: hypothetical protein IT349_04245 [Candidatus Eisenbacteria bacterium]|nr:hypothetical protein [Candidatus Eisenbacteria bacterium]
MRRARLASLLVSFLATTDVRAGARADALGGAASLCATEPRLFEANPALLGTRRPLELRLFDTSALAMNDSYSLRDYQRWNGAAWSEADKAQILGRINDEEFNCAARGSGLAPELYLGRWGVGFRTVAAARGALPREWVELALYGNAPGRTYTLDGADAAAILYSELAGASARPLWRDPTPDASHLLRSADLGLRLSLLRGWRLAEIETASGSLRTTIDAVEGNAIVQSRTAEGGTGVALDLGLSANLRSDWTVGLEARRLPGWIWWHQRPERHRSTVTADSLTLEDAGEDDLIDSRTDSRAIATFRGALAPSLRLAVSRRHLRWTFEGDLERAWSNSAETNRTPRLALGARFLADEHLEWRTGITVGGVERVALAAGVGVRIRSVGFDLALQSVGSAHVFEQRGVGAALAVSLFP